MKMFTGSTAGNLPINSDQAEAKAVCHFIVQTHDMSDTAQTKKYNQGETIWIAHIGKTDGERVIK
jgi:hypothetical protein